MIHLTPVAMVRRGLMLGLAIALLVFSAPARANTPAPRPSNLKLGVGIEVGVLNSSSTCVWVSVAYSWALGGWTWMTEPGNRARFLKPNERYDFNMQGSTPAPIPVPMEVKVEGTFMENADCSGKHAREITTERKGIFHTASWGMKAKARAALRGTSPSTYSVSVDAISD